MCVCGHQSFDIDFGGVRLGVRLTKMKIKFSRKKNFFLPFFPLISFIAVLAVSLHEELKNTINVIFVFGVAATYVSECTGGQAAQVAQGMGR
jgi:hypothetical protein